MCLSQLGNDIQTFDIAGVEKVSFMTSHRVAVLVAIIVGLPGAFIEASLSSKTKSTANMSRKFLSFKNPSEFSPLTLLRSESVEPTLTVLDPPVVIDKNLNMPLGLEGLLTENQEQETSSDNDVPDTSLAHSEHPKTPIAVGLTILLAAIFLFLYNLLLILALERIIHKINSILVNKIITCIDLFYFFYTNAFIPLFWTQLSSAKKGRFFQIFG